MVRIPCAVSDSGTLTFVNRIRMLLAGGAVLLAAAALAGPHQPRPPPASAVPANPQIRQEIVDRQPSLIDAAVARIAESSAPGAQVYFLGFAGFGDERVFAE